MNRIALYGMTREKAEKVSRAAASEGIGCSVFADDSLFSPAESVFERDNTVTEPGQKFSREFILYDGFTVESIRSFSHTMKRYGIAFDGIRIRLTQENRQWTVSRLLETAEAEYETAVKLKVLGRMIEAAVQYVRQNPGSDSSEKLAQYAREAYTYLHGREFTLQETDRHCFRLSHELRQLERTVN